MTATTKKTSRPNVPSAKGWIILGALAGVVAITGGASRFDAIQIVPLRTVSAFFLVLSLAHLTRERLRSERALVGMFACFVLIVGLQLVPLPQSVWAGLSGRSDVVRLDTAFGLEAVWRPLTLTPMRTWNVFGSLVVPAAGLFFAIATGRSSLWMLRCVAVLGVINAVLGLLQVVAGKFSSLYFYEITNRGSPVGIFANENHAAMFSACAMLTVAALGVRVRQGEGVGWERLAYPAAFSIMLLVSLVGGSRAGFAASIGVVGVSIGMLVLVRPSRGRLSARNYFSSWIYEHPRLMMVLPILALSLTAVTFIVLNRAPAFNELISTDGFQDLRWLLWPVIREIIEVYWIGGSGFGSFEQVYYVFEPSSLLMPQYVNQAHNDWAQFLVEGGILAQALLIALVLWVAKSIVSLSLSTNGRIRAVFWISIFAVLGLASLIDYPGRTPIFQLVGIWLLVALSRDVRDTKAT